MNVESGNNQPNKAAASVYFGIMSMGLGLAALLVSFRDILGFIVRGEHPASTVSQEIGVDAGMLMLMIGLALLAKAFIDVLIEIRDKPTSIPTQPEDDEPEPADTPVQGS